MKFLTNNFLLLIRIKKKLLFLKKFPQTLPFQCEKIKDNKKGIPNNVGITNYGKCVSPRNSGFFGCLQKRIDFMCESGKNSSFHIIISKIFLFLFHFHFHFFMCLSFYLSYSVFPFIQNLIQQATRNRLTRPKLGLWGILLSFSALSILFAIFP